MKVVTPPPPPPPPPSQPPPVAAVLKEWSTDGEAEHGSEFVLLDISTHFSPTMLHPSGWHRNVHLG